MELRHIEGQVLHEEAPSEQGSSVVGHVETSRHAGASAHGVVGNTDTSPVYNFNISFEDLSNVGYDEPPRHPNPTWMVRVLFQASYFVLCTYLGITTGPPDIFCLP